MAIPGGARGPVVIDFATSMMAGGWLHSARAAGALVPEGSIIDADGNPSCDPKAYFEGGAILPKGWPMGYGLAVMAEMVCDAMLGPASTECNWLTLGIDKPAIVTAPSWPRPLKRCSRSFAHAHLLPGSLGSLCRENASAMRDATISIAGCLFRKRDWRISGSWQQG